MGPIFGEGVRSAGWFEDPHNQFPLRYYDGVIWTDRTLGEFRDPKKGGASSGAGFIEGVLSAFSGKVWSNIFFEKRGSLYGVVFEGKKVFHFADVFLLMPAVLIALGALSVGGLFSGSTVGFFEFLANSTVGLGLFLLGVTGSVCVFFLKWRVYTIIKDTPTVQVAGAHLGPCEFEGVVEPYFAPTVSIFSYSVCVWVRSFVQRYRHSDRKSGGRGGGWETMSEVVDGSPMFYLKDDDGERILVDLREEHTRSWAYAPAIKEVSSNVRCGEEILPVGQRLFVSGFVEVGENGDLVVLPQPTQRSLARRKTDFVAYPGNEKDVLAKKKNVLLLLAIQLVFGLSAVSTYVSSFFVDRSSSTFVPVLITANLLVFLFVVIGGWVWRTWNRLVEVKFRYQAAWGLVDVFSQRRHDLIPSLESVSSGNITHEVSTQVTLSGLRSPTIHEISDNIELQKSDAETLTGLLALMENNPTVQGNESFEYLIKQVSLSESQIAAGRKFYNDAVTVAHTLTGQLPTSLLAGAVFKTVPPYYPDDSDV